MIQINKSPSKKDLGWFGLLCLAFFGFIGLSLWHKSHSLHAATIVWAAAAIGVAIYYIIPALQRPIYLGWMYAAYPIGWVVSHVFLAIAFFGVIFPIAVVMRAMSRDALARSFDPAATSYWSPHDPGTDPDRYFRQF
jgi:TRAP-type C4-dicarboxylate transport system permease small subunit